MNEEDIFFQASQKSVEEREAFLHEACGSDEALRLRVVKLLHAMEHPEGFLEAPVLADTASLSPAEPAGSFIGPYKLLQKLGEGGMGAVWVAEQERPVNRRVALKLIKPGMDTVHVMTRFRAEQQALALMDHTNIAKVFDAGTSPQGRPYFVMELVKGVPITKYCDEVHASIRDRLDLFLQVCSAVQHAHQKGIIHRDIKPSNVLVAMQDGKPVPKVIDFGVAKALHAKLAERTMYTEIGQVIGTLEYMAPEQAELSAMDIDTRADIYALGILLYELLTGSTPITRQRMKSAALAEILRMIKEEEAPKPSTRLSQSQESLANLAAQRRTDPKHLTSELRGELDWVVLKALEKDRTRRYETANGLSRDLQRYLANEPVEARPASVTYRMKKFVRRNLVVVIAAALVLTSLITGVIGTALGLVRAEEQRALAELSSADAFEAKTRETNRAEGERVAKEREAAHRVKAEAARDRTATVLDAMTSDVTGDALASQKDLTEEQKQFLTQVLTYYKELTGEAAEDEKTKARTARAASRVALIEYRLGRGDEAITANRVAVERLGGLASEFPRVVDYRVELAKAHRFQSLLFTDHQPNHLEALQHLEKAFSALQSVVDEFPREPRYRSEIVDIHLNLALSYRRFDKTAQAAHHHRQAMGLLEGLTTEYANVPGQDEQLAKHLLREASLKFRPPTEKEAVEKLRRAMALYEVLVTSHPENAKYRQPLGNAHLILSSFLARSGKQSEGEEHARKALVIHEKLVDDFPSNHFYRSTVANNIQVLGRIMNNKGKKAEAEAFLRQALQVREKLHADLPKRSHYRWLLGIQYNSFGDFMVESGRLADSLEWYGKAILTLAPVTQEKPFNRMSVENTLYGYGKRAEVLQKLNRFAEAAKNWELALELCAPEDQHYYRAYRTCARIRAGQADAVLDLAELTKSSLWDALRWYDFACAYAIASAWPGDQQQAHAARAMELLRKAVDVGFKDHARVAKDTDLNPLRGREDFRKLQAELETKTEKK